VNALLDLGVRRLSVAPAALGRIKAAIAAYG
jgi:phosphoenolpyruvate-protein kinase (PTS system EI component)